MRAGRLTSARHDRQESVAAAAEEQKPKLCGTNPGAAHSTPGKDAAGQGGASAEEEEDDFQAPSKAAASSFKWGDDLDKLLMRVRGSHRLFPGNDAQPRVQALRLLAVYKRLTFGLCPLQVVELSSKIHGWPTAGTEAARKNIYLPMCKFWPDWLPMDVKTLQARYKVAQASPAANATTPLGWATRQV